MLELLNRIFPHRSERLADQVRHSLLQVFRENIKLSVEVPFHVRSLVLSCFIEQLREGDVIVTQPVIDGRAHPLAMGEPIKIGFVQGSKYHAGECHCMGRISVEDEQGGAKPCYRISYPPKLVSYERREAPRLEVVIAHDVEAQLYACAALARPVAGRVCNISMTGAGILVPSQTLSQLEGISVGQQLYFKAMLPEPVGKVDDLVTVARIAGWEIDPQFCIVGVRFHQRIEGLSDLLRAV